MMVAYTLWVVTLLSLVVGQIAGNMHRTVVEERAAIELSELRVAAISGFEAYRLVLKESSVLEYSHMQQPFRFDPLLCAFQTAPGIRTISFHTEESSLGGPLQLSFGAVDEESRLNVLLSDENTLRRLPGVSRQMAEALIAWFIRHPDITFWSIEDLRAVPGWATADLEAINRLITFYGAGKININTTSPDVLRLAGLSNRAVGEMLEFMAGQDRVRGTEDDQFFKGTSEIVPRLEEWEMREDQLDEWQEAIDREWFTTLSRFFHVRARSINETTGKQFEVNGVIELDEVATVVAWREYQPA